MSSRRQRIAALRAKAASTTFPAEAEALRAKADELEGLEPKTVVDAADRFVRRGPIVYFWVDEASNYNPHLYNRDEDPPQPDPESEGGWMTVTDINGRTHRERIW